LVLLVSLTTILSSLLTLWPSQPCTGMRVMVASSCATGGLNWLYLGWGVAAFVLGVSGVVGSLWPSSPVRGR
jgi:hypothetical protein